MVQSGTMGNYSGKLSKCTVTCRLAFGSQNSRLSCIAFVSVRQGWIKSDEPCSTVPHGNATSATSLSMNHGRIPDNYH